MTQIELIKKYNLAIRGHLGQHLLVDPNMQRKIVDLLELRPREKVFEIGPGLGALTGEILRRGAEVWAVERDEKFVRILAEELKDYIPKKLHLTRGDVLAFDFKSILSKKGHVFKVVGNLPYYISAPILFYLADYRAAISKAVLTLQKEVAQRLTASPGRKSYGRLSLAMRYFAEVEHAFDISSSCFTPRPGVNSSVMILTFHSKPSPLTKQEEKKLFDLIALAFSQRRKTLFSLLSHNRKMKADRKKIAEIFERLGFSRSVRGEELLLKDYLALAEALEV